MHEFSFTFGRPVLLLLDNHRTRWTTAVLEKALEFRKNGIHILLLPKNLTWLLQVIPDTALCALLLICCLVLQPLDVGVFAQFKAALRQAVDVWMRTHSGDIPWQHIVEATASAFSVFQNPSLLRSAFRQSGLVPENRAMILEKIARFSAPWMEERARRAAESAAKDTPPAPAPEVKASPVPVYEDPVYDAPAFLTSIPPFLRSAADVQQVIDEQLEKRKRRKTKPSNPRCVLFSEANINAVVAARKEQKAEAAKKKQATEKKRKAAKEKKDGAKERKEAAKEKKGRKSKGSDSKEEKSVKATGKRKRSAAKKKSDSTRRRAAAEVRREDEEDLELEQDDATDDDDDDDDEVDEDTDDDRHGSSSSSSSSSAKKLSALDDAATATHSQCALCSAPIRAQRAAVPLCRDCRTESA